MDKTIRLYSLPYSDIKTYLFATLFILGNILLPQVCHFLPQGGITWLPIYFFTLIGAYKYGWKVGMLTAIGSPVVNCLLFGMPQYSVLPAIVLKSILLAISAGYVAYKFQKASLLLLLIVVLFYQIIGTSVEWIFTGSFYLAIQDFRIGIPGMLLQVVGGYVLLSKVRL